MYFNQFMACFFVLQQLQYSNACGPQKCTVLSLQQWFSNSTQRRRHTLQCKTVIRPSSYDAQSRNNQLCGEFDIQVTVYAEIFL